MVSNSQKVLIVGAGISGLVLAQILRANAIEFEIFERDDALESRNTGWSVSLAEYVSANTLFIVPRLTRSRALPHLEEMLPTDLGDLSTLGAGYGAGVLDDVVLYDAIGNKIIDRYGGGTPGTPSWVLRPFRPNMRRFLWPHVHVQTGKAFSYYTEDIASGTITAHFADGSSSTGTLLVGADGGKSRVRKAMLGEELSKVQPGEFQVVLLDVKLTKAQYEAFCQISTSTVVLFGDKVSCVAAIRESFTDGSAVAFLNVASRVDDPAAEAAWLSAASKASRYKRAKENLNRGSFPSWFHELVEQATVDGVSDQAIILNEYVPPAKLPRGSATLLGDALHCMMPFKGAGANTAIRDAADLARALIKHKDDGAGADTILREYEAIALPRGADQVLTSRAVAQSMNGDDWRARLMKGRHSTKDGEDLSKEIASEA